MLQPLADVLSCEVLCLGGAHEAARVHHISRQHGCDVVAMPSAGTTQARIPRVGVLWHAANIEEETPVYQNLVKGFSDLGYIDGQNITLEHRFPNEVPEVFDKMAAELVSLNCDVLVGAGAAAPHLKKSNKHNPNSVYVYS
jgi:putative ABC transport system substrate-binding protein